jgi:AraC-like DNA-binding protein
MQPSPKEVWGCSVAPGPYDGLAGTIARICEEWRGGGSDILKLLSAHHRLQGLLLRLLATNSPTVAPASLYQRILHAESVAWASWSEEFGVEQFAAAAGLGCSRFAQVYRHVRGRAPGAFLAEKKLQRAQALLFFDGMSVADTARNVGFRSVSAFIRFFRRHTGQSPDRWRAESKPPEEVQRRR